MKMSPAKGECARCGRRRPRAEPGGAPIFGGRAKIRGERKLTGMTGIGKKSRKADAPEAKVTPTLRETPRSAKSDATEMSDSVKTEQI